MKQRYLIFLEDKAVQHRNIRLLMYNFGIKSFGIYDNYKLIEIKQPTCTNTGEDYSLFICVLWSFNKIFSPAKPSRWDKTQKQNTFQKRT